MSESSVKPPLKPNDQLNFQEQQQRDNANFFKKMFQKATEHSKKLTLLDTIIYLFLMVGFTVVMVIWPELADSIVSAMAYTTTTHVSLQLAYFSKATIENIKKVQGYKQLEENNDYTLG